MFVRNAFFFLSSWPLKRDVHSLAMVYTDNKVALRQLEIANAALLNRTSLRAFQGTSLAKDGRYHPRVLTLVSTDQFHNYCLTCSRCLRMQGGDHTITLPLLRGVAGTYGPVR